MKLKTITYETRHERCPECDAAGRHRMKLNSREGAEHVAGLAAEHVDAITRSHRHPGGTMEPPPDLEGTP